MRPTVYTLTLLLSALLTLACDDSEPQTLRFADTDMICVNKLGAAYVEDKNTCDPGYSWYCDVHGPTIGTSACCDDEGDCVIMQFGSECPLGTAVACGPAPEPVPPLHVCGGADGVNLWVDGDDVCDAGYEHYCNLGEFALEGVAAVCCTDLSTGADCSLVAFGTECPVARIHACDKV